MTDNTLAIYTNRATNLLTVSAENDVKEAARKLMRLTPGGTRLTADQATDLAVYALLTGLNPFNNECYFMDKVGIVPGISGYRTKAMDWLLANLQATGQRVDIPPRIWEEYRIATIEEADFDPDKGDVAWVCTLFDSISRDAWEAHRIMIGLKYREMGASFKEAYELSHADAGTCPHWEAVGVVHADEHFSGNVWKNNQKVEGEYKAEMWDRNERAKKRAAKGCYRKGFPKMNIPDAEDGEYINQGTEDLKIRVVDAIKAEKLEDKNQPRLSNPELLADFGIESTPAQAQTAHSPVETIPAAAVEVPPAPLPGEWPDEFLQKMVTLYKVEHKNQIINALKMSTLKTGTDLRIAREWMRIYKAERDLQVSTVDSAKTANDAMDAFTQKLIDVQVAKHADK